MSLLTPDRPYLYKVDQWPGPAATVMLALQWLVVLVPGVLVLGQVLAQMQGLESRAHIDFLQRIFLVLALVQGGQVLSGHRLPGVVGPSAVLMVGIISTIPAGLPAIYGGMLVAGGLAALVGLSGLAARLTKIFTPPVLGSTLILIAVTLSPAMRDLLFSPETKGGPAISLLFGLALTLTMLWAQHRLRGLWSSSVLVLGIAIGSGIYYLLGLGAGAPLAAIHPAQVGLPTSWTAGLEFNPPVIASFCLCYLAVISNELATVEALGEMSGAANMGRRANGAVLAGGLGGVLAGLMGVPGPVTYSVSPAVAISSRSLSRFTLLPAAGVLFLFAFWPGGIELFNLAPSPVVGAVLLLLMASTVFAAVGIATGNSNEGLSWRSGVILGTAMITGLLVSFMPSAAKESLPPALAPLLGNGFVMGLVMALVLEHALLKKRP